MRLKRDTRTVISRVKSGGAASSGRSAARSASKRSEILVPQRGLRLCGSRLFLRPCLLCPSRRRRRRDHKKHGGRKDQRLHDEMSWHCDISGWVDKQKTVRIEAKLALRSRQRFDGGRANATLGTKSQQPAASSRYLVASTEA